MAETGLNMITFHSTDEKIWLSQLVNEYESLSRITVNDYDQITFDESIDVKNIKPLHIVTLACLIRHLSQLGHSVLISPRHKGLFDYIYNDLGFFEYFGGGKNHVETRMSSHIFNLWRIIEEEKDVYAKNIENYFQRKYFQDKDLSVISLCLVEAYYNVFDHADANGNAFSIIQYDESVGRLYVAISDFGIGIAQSVRRFNKNISSDSDAIKMAIEDRFTVGSTKRNRGMGLGNILSSADKAIVISNHGMAHKKDGSIKTFELDFTYPGTLLCFEMDLSTMENREIMDEFNI